MEFTRDFQEDSQELTWNRARIIEEDFNLDKGLFEPRWSFDCGFKLDFDGPLIRISSRFYPPIYNSGEGWEGSLHISVKDRTIEEVKFKCNSLDELKFKVESYVDLFEERFIESFIKTIQA